MLTVRFSPGFAPMSCSLKPGMNDVASIFTQKFFCSVSPRAVGETSVIGLPSVVPV